MTAEPLLAYPALFFAAFAFGHAWWRPRRPRLTMLGLLAAFTLFAFAGAGLLAFATLVAGFAWSAWRWRAYDPPLPPPSSTATVYRAVVAEREGKYLLIRVPELDGVTQARHEGEVETMARSLISIMLDVDVADVAVDLDWKVPR